jgi:hypothetical protein
MPLTQLEREATGAVEGTPREGDSVEAGESGEVEEAEVAKEGVDPHTTPMENRSLSLSRNPSPREELVKNRSRRCHHRHLTRTWPM